MYKFKVDGYSFSGGFSAAWVFVQERGFTILSTPKQALRSGDLRITRGRHENQTWITLRPDGSGDEVGKVRVPPYFNGRGEWFPHRWRQEVIRSW